MGGGTIYEPLSLRQTQSTLVPVVPTFVVHSYAVLEADFSNHQVPPGTKAILYDNERFADTPLAEQANPGYYDSLVAAAAASHHMLSICDFIQPDRLSASQRIPSAEVPKCDIVGLNTVQQSERNPQQYAATVRHIIGIIDTVNPQLPAIAGLSTNPAGPPVTATELVSDIRATQSFVAGYWLNVPSPGVGCPNCHAPDPAILESAMSMLAVPG